MTKILIDSLIITLLIASLGYGVMVTRRLKILMAAIKELEPLVQEFSIAVDKSESSVNEMKRSLDTAHTETPAFEYGQSERHVSVGAKKAESKAARSDTQAGQSTKELVQSFFAETLVEKGA
jgi:hypothetical protein